MILVRTLLAVLITLSPVMGAICAEPCDDTGPVRTVEAALSCEHVDTTDAPPVLTAAACSSDRAELVPAEIRHAAPAARLSMSVTQTALEPQGLPALERYLRFQPPPAPSRTVLRI